MPTLNVRNIPEDLYRRLRVRAAEEGESMEGFVRKHLRTLAVERSVDGSSREGEQGDAARSRFRELSDGTPLEGLTDELLEERRGDVEDADGTEQRSEEASAARKMQTSALQERLTHVFGPVRPDGLSEELADLRRQDRSDEP